MIYLYIEDVIITIRVTSEQSNSLARKYPNYSLQSSSEISKLEFSKHIIDIEMLLFIDRVC